MAELRLPYDPGLEAQQNKAVKLSTQGEFNRAEGMLTQAIEDIHDIEGTQTPLETLANVTHLARLQRDLGLNSLRFAGVTWTGKPARTSAIESAAKYLNEADGHHHSAQGIAAAFEKGRYVPHVTAEEGATATAQGRILGLQLLGAREAGNGSLVLYLEKAIADKFAWAQSRYEKGDNAFYKVNGALVEAMYLKVLLGRPALEKVQYAKSIALEAEGTERLKCGASLVRRTLEIAFKATPETLLHHI